MWSVHGRFETEQRISLLITAKFIPHEVASCDLAHDYVVGEVEGKKRVASVLRRL